MQDVDGVLFGAPQRGLKAGAQGHRSAGMEQQKADNHHSERKSVTNFFCFWSRHSCHLQRSSSQEQASRQPHMAWVHLFLNAYQCQRSTEISRGCCTCIWFRMLLTVSNEYALCTSQWQDQAVMLLYSRILALSNFSQSQDQAVMMLLLYSCIVKL